MIAVERLRWIVIGRERPRTPFRKRRAIDSADARDLSPENRRSRKRNDD